MIAGVPGAGINGAFYLLLAALMPVREIGRRLITGRAAPAGRWRRVSFLLSIALGVFLVLWAEYWLMERIVDSLIRHAPTPHSHAAQVADTISKIAPRLTYMPLMLLACVIGVVHLLRLGLRLAARFTARRAALLLIFGAMVSVLSGCRTAREAVAVYPPPGYDFASAPPSIRAEYDSMEDFYQAYFDKMTGSPANGAYGLALANQIIGLVRNDPAFIVRARGLFAMHRDATSNARERELASLGEKYDDCLLTGNFRKASAEPKTVVPIQYVKDPPPTNDFHKVILGRSVIRVTNKTLIKTQVDRVTRDWLLAFRVKGAPWDFEAEEHASWHEGAKLTELVEFTQARVVPVWGLKATKIGEKWYAPDATGAPRFEISEDKVNDYPSTIVVDDHTAIVNDTHGISAIAWDALDANLVVGCGDHRGKMDAAFYLAARGVNVYAPTDRFMGLLIGARTRATILGSAPIKKTAEGAEIGNQPVAFDVSEPIVVSNAPQRYPLQYYDTPYRYFTALRDYIGKPLKITGVQVTEYGKAMNVVAAARKLGARVLGIRVKSAQEHDAVAGWLKEDPARRAVLFHTAAYAEGYKLFAEFPSQTTFGDIRPAFE